MSIFVRLEMDRWLHARNVKQNRRLVELESCGFTKDILYDLYRNQCFSIPDLKKKFPKIDIYYWMKKWGIPRRRTHQGFMIKKARQTKVKGLTRFNLRKLYYEDKLSLRAIGKELGVEGMTVFYWMKRYNMPRRTKSESNAVRPIPDSMKEKISKKQKEYFSNPKNREARSRIVKEEFASGKRKVNTKAANKKTREMWADPEIKEIWLGLIGENTLPTIPEIRLFDLIELACLGEYKYTGDGSFVIGGMKPDFTHCNGQQKVIEMYGDYWHQGENPQDRIDAFSEHGFDCLVIWQSELKSQTEEQLVDRIKEFHEVGVK